MIETDNLFRKRPQLGFIIRPIQRSWNY